MHRVEPKAFLIGATAIRRDELTAYLKEIGAEGWESDAKNDIAEIVEVYSRGCYMSFDESLNDNLTRVRKTNIGHIKNIIEQQHGCVMTHGYLNFQFTGISRVFTAELCRHPTGAGISERSLRT